jgi:hypothetical protein
MTTAASIETSNSVDPYTRRRSECVACALLRVAVVSLARGEEPYLLLTQDVVKAVRMLQLANPKWITDLANAKCYYNAAVMYITINGLLYKGTALIVLEDPSLRIEIIRMYHDDPLIGHFALAKCKDLITRKYFWLEIK